MILGGRYRVERELGRGGMAKVYLGKDTVLGRTVAVKILAPQFADDPNFVTRFRREAQAAARISNQNLVSVFDTGSDDGVHFIVMEYVEGRTLAQFLTGGGRIMPDRAIDIAMDVCRALSAAHAQGVVHRDIKPGNIMLDDRGDVKVTDFGIARVVTTAETVAQTAAVLGTASYLSPEQAQGQPVDGRTDIYSLGCVLFEMVTGRPPFLGDSPVAVASKQVLEQPTPPSRLNPDVSPDLDAVILRALAKNPENRYASADDLRADLERVRRGMPVEATPLLSAAAGATQVIQREPSAPTAVLPPAAAEPERSRWWIPVLVTLLILAVLGGVLFVLAQNLLNDDEEPGSQLVAVPNVVGERFNEARRTLEDEGFVVVTPPLSATQEEFPDAEPGTVVEQVPSADEEVEEGAQVTLTVVESPEAVTLPTGLTGQDPESVIALLEALDADLELLTQEEPSDEVDEGFVTRTDPPEGSEVEPGSTVTVFVSTGQELVSVPDVRCLAVNAAQNRLEQDGLQGVISGESVAVNPNCPLGNKVADQSPAPLEEVAPGTIVQLFFGAEAPPTGPTGPSGGTGPTADDD
ncbi:MAG: Stk1 family PASTA domain-containing Ser/Thr kinase [Actinomycetota bacterium]